MISNWFQIALMKKSPATVAKEASVGNSIINLIVASFLVFFVSALIQIIVGPISVLTTGGNVITALVSALGGLIAAIIGAIILPIAIVIGLVIGTALVHITAKILGGQGSYSQLLATMGMIDASIQGTLTLGLTIIIGLLTIIVSLLGPLGVMLVAGLGVISSIVSFVIGIYSLFLNSKGVGAVHKFSTMKGFLSIIIPMIVIGILVAILIVIGIIIFGAAILAGIAANAPDLSGAFGLPF